MRPGFLPAAPRYGVRRLGRLFPRAFGSSARSSQLRGFPLQRWSLRATFLRGFSRPNVFQSHRLFSSYPEHEKLEMPALSPTMEQGNIASWTKNEGEYINPGDVMAEVETDKATVAYEAVDGGYLAKILVPAGSKDVPVGTVVAILVEEQADIAAFAAYSGDAPAAAPAAAPATEPSPPPAQPASNTSYPDHDVLEMPALSPTMEQGNIASWAKNEGEYINPGDVMAEVETDKATVAYEAVDGGYLAKILVPAGSKDVPVGTPVAVLVEEQADIAAFAAYSGDAPAAAPAAAPASSSEPVTSTSSPTASASASPSSSSRVFASPAARKLASSKNFDISAIPGTGPSRRVVVADVQEYVPVAASAAAAVDAAPAAASAAKPAKSIAAATPAAADGDFTDVPHTNVRKIIADRLTKSKQEIPHYYLTADVRVDAVMKMRSELNASLAAADNGKLSVNDFVIKASALALKTIPETNASWLSDCIRQYSYVDISVAVSTDGGLITPIVQDADLKGLNRISKDVKELASRARQGTLQPNEYQGGTFTISNLGMFGVKSFSAIINPPQAAILAVGGSESRVVVSGADEEGNPTYESASYMTVTLSCDHRVIDGAVGAQWLKAFKGYMENPMTLML